MIADRAGNRKTATEAATDIMEEAALRPVEVWHGLSRRCCGGPIDANRLTDRERRQVERQIYKKYAQIRKLLGFAPL